MRNKGFFVAVLITITSTVLGVLTLGLPGAVVFAFWLPLLQAVAGTISGTATQLTPDAFWPIAIVISLLWPISILVAYLIVFRLTGRHRRLTQIAAYIGILSAWGGMLSTGCYLLAQRT